jgi:adenylate cyclase
MERRLAAILIADVAGYSRLSQIDEEATRLHFLADLNEVFIPKIAEHHGRLVKTMGDGLLVEFHSVVNAVQCATEIQHEKRSRNTSVPTSERLEFRIGVNLGDIIVEGDDIHGDGVNIAARIQGLAEPGGIAVSSTTYDQVKMKLDLHFVSIGHQKVRSIAEPILVYRVANAEATKRFPSVRGRKHLPRIAVASALLFVVAMVGLWVWDFGQAPKLLQRFAYPLPEKPSVAVLPFINVSGDAEQDHLAEGLTDDVITELSKVSGLFVIARHSVFALKSNVGRIQDVAAELGVHYVLEGTLQRAGPKLRINVKLIDALTGLSMWAERYDRQYLDLFAVQDDVTSKIITALEVELTESERDKIERLPSDNLEAYDYYMRAEHEGLTYSDIDTYRRSLAYYQKAITLDPDFADAHAGIARIAVDVWRNDYNLLWSAAGARKIAYDAAGQALKLDPENARAHTVLALLQLVDGRQGEARESADRAVGAQPNSAEASGNLALVLAYTGKREEAVVEIERALRLDPTPSPSFRLLAGIVFYAARHNSRAISLLQEATSNLPDAEAAREFLMAGYSLTGDQVRAAEEQKKLLTLFPESNLTYYRYLYDYWRAEDLNYHLRALRNAGIPDWPFGFVGIAADQVRGDNLLGITANKTWIGKHKNGTAFVQFFDRSGETAYRTANTSITGTVEIRGDQLCEQFDGYFLDRQVCGEVYQVPKGGPEGERYVNVTPQALKYFSPSP